MTILTRAVPYLDGQTPLTGELHWNSSLGGRRPGILLIHGGAGLDDHAKSQADRYAAVGYVVLACDMFGEGVAGNAERVIKHLTTLRDDPSRLVERGMAGLSALSLCPEVDGRFAAVGFCFGGLAALTLARSGAHLTAAVSIHGSLATTRPAGPGSVTAKVLACHGALDPHVPLHDVTDFADEMNRAGADWQLIMLGGAMHGFTHKDAVPGATPGVAYNAAADERSFAATCAFLAEATA